MNIESFREIEDTLVSLGVTPKKRWGQNFLLNRGARNRIVSLVDPREGETIWEIGPGLGAITELLLAHSAEFILFEIDWKLIRYLQKRWGNSPHVRIVPGDCIRTWKGVAEKELPEKIMGNLPYRSASAIIVSFIEEGLIPEKMVFTIQKDVAERMAARPGDKTYSSFSVLCQLDFSIVPRMHLKPGSFYPKPRVVSTVVEMVPHRYFEPPADRSLFSKLIRTIFSSRRKTIRNNLKNNRMGIPSENMLDACEETGIDPNRRGEEYDVLKYVVLADCIFRRIVDLKQEEL